MRRHLRERARPHDHFPGGREGHYTTARTLNRARLGTIDPQSHCARVAVCLSPRKFEGVCGLGQRPCSTECKPRRTRRFATGITRGEEGKRAGRYVGKPAGAASRAPEENETPLPCDRKGRRPQSLFLGGCFHHTRPQISAFQFYSFDCKFCPFSSPRDGRGRCRERTTGAGEALRTSDHRSWQPRCQPLPG